VSDDGSVVRANVVEDDGSMNPDQGDDIEWEGEGGA
jgi:hypothetical protein